MRDAYRYRKQDFKRRILKRDISRDQLLAEEHKWLDQIKDDELGMKYYNLSKHHFGHWANNEESRKTIAEKLSIKNKGQGLGRKLSDETRKKIGNSKRGNSYFLGMTHSEETRQKMSIAAKQRGPTMLGKKHSEETKRKMSFASKGRPKSKEHRENISKSRLKNRAE